MKKLNAKFIVSALIAASMITASAVSASASDYAKEKRHAYIQPEYTGSTGTTPSTPDPVNPEPEKVEDTATITEGDISGKSSLELKEDGNGNVVVSAGAIAAIAKGDKVFTVKADDADGIDYTIEIDPKLITEVKAINIAMNITVPTGDKTIDGVKVPAGSIIIDPAQSGAFGMTLKITIPASAVKDLDLDNANVYYISDDGEITLLKDALVKNSDGSVSISITHASAYVITDEDLLTYGEANIEDDDDDDDDDDDVTIDDTDATPSKGKDDSTVTVVDGSNDSNPVTGTTLALGSLAVFAAAAAITSKKRK